MEPLQQAAAVLLVLILLATAIYALRAKGVVMPRRSSDGTSRRQLESIDRLALTPNHSLHLVRVEGRTVLVAVSPGGCTIVDRGTEHLAAESAFALSREGVTR